jgi:hypothetical protein
MRYSLVEVPPEIYFMEIKRDNIKEGRREVHFVQKNST